MIQYKETMVIHSSYLTCGVDDGWINVRVKNDKAFILQDAIILRFTTDYKDAEAESCHKI